MRLNMLKAIALVPVLLIGLACQRASQTATSDDNSYKDSVKQALQQAELQDVTVDEDKDKNTITLGGKVHSENARQQAGEVAKAAAANRTIANEISVHARVRAVQGIHAQERAREGSRPVHGSVA